MFKQLSAGCFSIGSLVHVHPSYPADGERAKVDIFRIDNLLSYDPIARDLRSYPGPLIKSVPSRGKMIRYINNVCITMIFIPQWRRT